MLFKLVVPRLLRGSPRLEGAPCSRGGGGGHQQPGRGAGEKRLPVLWEQHGFLGWWAPFGVKEPHGNQEGASRQPREGDRGTR